MKLLLCLTISSLCTSSLLATVRNVNNANSAPVNTPYTYATLQPAIDDAVDGDTIYVHGTNISYGNATVDNKALVIIGAGFGNNLQKQMGLKSIIGTINFVNFDGTKDFTFSGLMMHEPKNGSSPTNKMNVLHIKRCGIFMQNISNNDYLRCNVLLVAQSVFTSDGGNWNAPFQPAVSNMAIYTNNVFEVGISGQWITAAAIDNNFFKHSYANLEVSNFNGTAVFKNNIFYSYYHLSATTQNNVFDYNCFNINTTGSLTNGNSGNGNLFNTNPMVTNAGPSPLSRENYSTQANLHLQTGSPCIGSGSGGTDMGIYGGLDPLPLSNIINGVPDLPRITGMSIQNFSVAPGGNLNVEINAVNQE